MKLFGKEIGTATLVFGAAMTALVDKPTVTSEEVDAANAELGAAGIAGAALITEAAFSDLSTKAGRVDTAEASVKAYTDALTAAGAKDMAELVAQRDEARQQAADFGSQPGELGTTAEKAKGDVSEEGGDANAKIVADLHEKMLQG
jgi:hypothetical protein